MKNQKWLLGLALLASSTLDAQSNALKFDGVDDYVDLGNHSLFNPSNIKSMEAWVKFNSLTGAQEIISKSSNSLGLEMLLFNNNLSVYAMNNAAGATSYISYPVANLSTGAWYHLAFSWDGTKESMRLYVNGVAVGSRTDIGNINTSGIGNPAGSLKLGRWSENSEPRPFNGEIDEVRIWSIQRSAADFNTGIAGQVAPSSSGLTAYYRMNEGTGTALANSTSNTGLNGTLINGTSWSAVAQPRFNNAVALDGVDDYVSIGSPLPSNSSYTKEAWVYVTKSISDPNNIISSNNSPFWISGGVLRAGNYGSTAELVDPGTFPANQWVHVAVTFDAATGALKMYRDGVLVNSTTTSRQYISQNNYVGAWFNSSTNTTSSYLGGKVEGVRIWNVARTEAQIKSNMLALLNGNETNLVRLFNFNQGVNGGNNSGLVTVHDGTANAAHGTLQNAALTGTTSNWIASPVQKEENAVLLDGTDDFLYAPANPAIQITTGTVEAWVRPNTLSGNATIVANRGTGGTRYSFHMSNSLVGLWNGSTWNYINHTFNPGEWYHLAFVCNASTTEIFVNGSKIGALNIGLGTMTGLPLHVGYSSTGEPYNGAIDEVRIWNIVRTPAQIAANKDYSLTGSEANLVALYNFNQGISQGLNTGLVSIIDQSVTANNGTLRNMGLSGNTSNFTSHSLATPTEGTLPLTLVSFKAAKKEQAALLTWSTSMESNTSHFEVERSNNGVNFTRLDNIKAAGNSSQTRFYQHLDGNPEAGANFYRLKMIDLDGSFTYSPVILLQWKTLANVSVYVSPQPIKSVSNIYISGFKGLGQLAIFNTTGNLVKTLAIKSSGETVQVPVSKSGLAAGVCFFKFYGENGVELYSGKMIID